jgi:hypothetical protein
MPYTGGYPQAADVKVARGRYDFAVDGGTIGDINLTVTSQIPANAVILGGFCEVDTAVTSGGSGTLAIKVEGAGDIVAGAAVSGAPWSTTGRKSVIPAFTGATTVKTTAARKIVATVAVADLTAGAVDVVLFYTQLPD